ncbi:DUF3363 domain-containing protein [Glycocaulis profundi]|nr:DUF3363 domain-containing protein [Glycocaulis profundi]
MSGPDEFEPRLGRIRDLGRRAGGRAARQLRRAIARAGGARKRSAFTGARAGTGGAARTRSRATAHLARQRVRRVIVKMHIARAGRAGPGLFRAHLGYLQRDGVERGGEGGQLYDRERDQADPGAFLSRSEEDRHQFRIIVSPEDGVALGDLKPVIREFMERVERDTGRRLDWVAADHHNTGHPHTHIVIRGRDYQRRDIVLAKDYLMNGLREVAEDIVTARLGPRRDLEILRARHSEVAKDRLTGIDRAMARDHPDGAATLARARTEAARFDRHLRLARLKHLEGLGLAEPAGPGAWTLAPGWTDALAAMGRQGDIIRTLSRSRGDTEGVRFAETRAADAPPLTGTVQAYGPENELRDTRFLLVEDFHGHLWHVPAAAMDADNRPPKGAVVEIARQPRKPLRADQTIAAIAERSGGLWSDTLHAQSDPGSSPGYRLAHKRRLEALRRAGIVERLADGRWAVPEDYLDRAAAHEARRSAGLRVRTLSWMALETQIEAEAEIWLDTAPEAGGRLTGARAARQAFLRRAGHLRDGEDRLDPERRQALRANELRRAALAEAARSGRTAASLAPGDTFEGRLEGHVDLAQGRMAVIGHEKAFVLVPWRDAFARQRGRALVIEQRARGVGWTLAVQRALQR